MITKISINILHKKESFFSWLGLKKPEGNKGDILKFVLCSFVVCIVLGLIVFNLFLKSEWNHSEYAEMGIYGIPGILLMSYVQTALSEEILFRGFLQKRLQKQFGFVTGTAIQAVLFGAAHIIPAFNQLTLLQGILIFLYPIIPGVLIPILNEKKCNGSIIPGWAFHGTLNVVSHVSQMFI